MKLYKVDYVIIPFYVLQCIYFILSIKTMSVAAGRDNYIEPILISLIVTTFQWVIIRLVAVFIERKW